MLSADSVRERVARAALASLICIAGGGYAATTSTSTTASTSASTSSELSSAAEEASTIFTSHLTSTTTKTSNINNHHGNIDKSNNCNNDLKQQWREELKKIAYTSISFPNGINNQSVDGKSHDVEVRAALTLFHRIHRRVAVAEEGRHTNNGGAAVVKKKKKGKDKKLHKRKRKKISCNESESLSQKEDNGGVVASNTVTANTFELISDLGTCRNIDSIQSLANLLSLELEKELTTTTNNNICNNSSKAVIQNDQNDNNNDQTNNINAQQQQQPTTTTATTTPSSLFFADNIRPSESGIIFIVSTHRSQRLHDAGRIPCAHCTRWFKGSKGLWWHQISVHGVEYEMATEVAQAGADSSLAIVPFGGWLGGNGDGDGGSNFVPMMMSEEEGLELRVEEQQCVTGTSPRPDIDAFDMVKLGKLDEFVKLVEGGYPPESQLDRNGASVLHWSAGCGHLDFVTYLLEQCKCCPNQAQRGKRSFMGRTPLHWAARNGHLNVVKYLVCTCRVEIDAKTSDGTTAFCWASWQGHLDIMKCLHRSGCDIHTTNTFGCNAVLWSAQGAGTIESMAWLLQTGLNFKLVNSNGHSALHKAAQRGSGGAVKWLVTAFLFEKEMDVAFLIGPDTEGNCPSDLCGMEGHESLARWISVQECDYFARTLRAKSVKDLYDIDCIPSWLQKEVHETKKCIKYQDSDAEAQWGAGCGVRRMVLNLLGRTTTRCASNNVAIETIHDLNDID